MQFVFFGTDAFSIAVLDELEKAGLTPSLVVTAPDKPKGRGMKMTPSPVAEWAAERSIEILKPEKLDEGIHRKLSTVNCKLFIVASYGKIIPKHILDIPEHGTLNVHPSLLPLFRGASPIQSQILSGAEAVGVTIMLMDEKMDHGPIVAQRQWAMTNVKAQISNQIQMSKSKEGTDAIPTAGGLEEFLAHDGGKLLADVMPQWVRGEIEPQEQDHDAATYTQKFTKEDARIDIHGNPEEQFRKIQAFTPSPGTYFFTQKNGKEIRVKITDAKLEDGVLIFTSVIPEGKREMPYADFAQDETHTNM